jgi:hypothetical protein
MPCRLNLQHNHIASPQMSTPVSTIKLPRCKATGCSRLSSCTMPSIKQVSRHSGLAPALELDTEDYCSKICARRTQTLVKCVAPGCDQLFLHASTISGNASPVFDNHNKYCSTNCHIVDRPDLKNTRTLVRIDDFLNHLFLAIRAVTSDCYLKSEVVVRGPAAHEELRLHVRVKEAKDNSFYNQGSTSGTGRRTMLSHNRCQTAVTNHAGIIAFLIEGRFCTHSMRLRSVS